MQVDDSEEVRAIVAELRRICARLPVAEEYVMVHHPAFRVGKKPFVIAGMQQDGESATLSVNLGREMQHQLLDDPRFRKTPYLGQHGWVTTARQALPRAELETLVVESWRRVANDRQRALLAQDLVPPAASKATTAKTKTASKAKRKSTR